MELAYLIHHGVPDMRLHMPKPHTSDIEMAPFRKTARLEFNYSRPPNLIVQPDARTPLLNEAQRTKGLSGFLSNQL